LENLKIKHKSGTLRLMTMGVGSGGQGAVPPPGFSNLVQI